MYYVIINNNIITAQTQEALTQFYSDVKKAPDDFEYGKYIVVDGELVRNTDWDEEQFVKAKQLKYEENDNKASEARYNQEFEITVQEQLCVFDTKPTTQADLLTAFAVCSTGETYDGWVTNNGVVLNLTIEDVALISQVFKQKSNVYGKWNEYKQAIDEAETIEEVQAILIDYGVNE